MTKRDIKLAYRAVFGTDGKRDAAQKIVWENLMANLKRPAFVPDASGKYDPLAAALADGGRRVLLQIEDILKEPIEEDQKPKTQKS